jgi:hypothetical protein
LPIILGFNSVRTVIRGERLDPFVEEVQVHLRPTYLSPTTAEIGSVGHDL